MSALSGIRVVDLSRGPVGGIATLVLADFGADVVKIEPPGGDRFRALTSAPMWLRGKRSAMLDLGTGPGREQLAALVTRADVVVASGSPARVASCGADWATLSGLNPELIHCHISGWGPSGPYAEAPGYEALVAARCGRLDVFAGQIDREGPVFAALPVGCHAAALGAVQGILAGLLARSRGAGGQRIETSLLRALLPYDLASLLIVQLARNEGGAVPDPRAIGGGMPTLNYHPVMCADGRWIQLGNLLEHHLYAFLDATDLLPELLAEEAFQAPPAHWSPAAVEKARDLILTRMRERKADEWMEIFRRNGNVAAETLLSAQEALEHPDLSDHVIEQTHPDHGRVRQLGALARLSATPARLGAPPRAVGADADAVFADLGARSSTPSPEALPNSPSTGRPLAGITVLEIATIIAAPLATTMLADLGARVIKIEAIGGDPYRHLLPRGILAVKANAGKESICVDLKSDAGQAILRDLVAKADVLVHNFRPGVPERLGIGFERLHANHPELIWVAATGYAPDAPGAGRPCAHPVAGAAMGGVVFQAGAGMPPADCATLSEVRDAARRLMRANEANPDPNTSVVIASAVLLGLVARERDGNGQAIDVNMLAANAFANADDFLSYAGKPARPAVDAELYGLGPGYRLYETADGWVFLAVTHDAEWSRLAAHCEPIREDARFATSAAREDHADILAATLARWFRQRTAHAWERLLLPTGVGCVRVASGVGEFVLDDPAGADLSCEVDHARFGRTRRWGPLVVCNGGPSELGAGALAGQHTDPLLAEIGRSEADIAELRAAGVVDSESP